MSEVDSVSLIVAGRRRAAPEAGARAVPHGRREPRGESRAGPARRGPHLGRGRRHARRMRRRFRRSSGDGTEPAREASRRSGLRSARGRGPDP
jgi:hypothetical protein